MIVVLAFVMLLILAELITAFVLYPLKTGKSYYSIIRDQKFAYMADPVTGFVLKPNYSHQKPPRPHPYSQNKVINFDIRTNADGFLFESEVDGSKQKLIFCLGDSVTMGSECLRGRSYPAVLDTMVISKGWRCVNASVGGYRSIHEYLYFKERVLPKKPAAVIIFSGYNDFEDYAFGFYKAFDSRSHSLWYYISRKKYFLYSALFHKIDRLFCERLGLLRGQNIPSKIKKKMTKILSDKTWLIEWAINIGRIVELCNKNKIKCFMLSYVSPFYEEASQEIREMAKRELGIEDEFDIYARFVVKMNKAVKELCKTTGVVYLDISSTFNTLLPETKCSYFLDRMHFTEEGNRFVAEAIFDLIKDKI